MERFKLELEKTALELRSRFGIESYGIPDIFQLIEKMDILLIRYPIGKNTICGFSTTFEGKKVIVSNSSEILSREIFTIAHELGHCIYDLQGDEQKVIIDSKTNEVSDNFIENRADYFAAVLLMPEEEVRKYVKFEIQKDFTELKARDVIRIQVEFNVSFSTVVKRLSELKLIENAHKNSLFEERERYTSKTLFQIMKLDDRLLQTTDLLEVPKKYYEYVLSNFENGYIVFDKLKEALTIVGVDSDSIKQMEPLDDEELDLDDLLGGY